MNRVTFCVILLSSVAGDCPFFVNRTEWGARPPKSTRPLQEIPPPFVVIHHSAGHVCNETEQCKEFMRIIQTDHMDNKGWNDIGYNFIVGGDGFVYEGRGWNIFGAHCPKYNSRSIGICLLGNFEDVLPSDLQLNSTKTFIECSKNQSYIAEEYHLIGHRQGRATKCPGNALFKEISTWPYFDRNPK